MHRRYVQSFYKILPMILVVITTGSFGTSTSLRSMTKLALHSPTAASRSNEKYSLSRRRNDEGPMSRDYVLGTGLDRNRKSYSVDEIDRENRDGNVGTFRKNYGNLGKYFHSWQPDPLKSNHHLGVVDKTSGRRDDSAYHQSNGHENVSPPFALVAPDSQLPYDWNAFNLPIRVPHLRPLRRQENNYYDHDMAGYVPPKRSDLMEEIDRIRGHLFYLNSYVSAPRDMEDKEQSIPDHSSMLMEELGETIEQLKLRLRELLVLTEQRDLYERRTSGIRRHMNDEDSNGLKNIGTLMGLESLAKAGPTESTFLKKVWHLLGAIIVPIIKKIAGWCRFIDQLYAIPSLENEMALMLTKDLPNIFHKAALTEVSTKEN